VDSARRNAQWMRSLGRKKHRQSLIWKSVFGAVHAYRRVNLRRSNNSGTMEYWKNGIMFKKLKA
jgi:hypothetical protein